MQKNSHYVCLCTHKAIIKCCSNVIREIPSCGHFREIFDTTELGVNKNEDNMVLLLPKYLLAFFMTNFAQLFAV